MLLFTMLFVVRLLMRPASRAAETLHGVSYEEEDGFRWGGHATCLKTWCNVTQLERERAGVKHQKIVLRG